MTSTAGPLVWHGTTPPHCKYPNEFGRLFAGFIFFWDCHAVDFVIVLSSRIDYFCLFVCFGWMDDSKNVCIDTLNMWMDGWIIWMN